MQTILVTGATGFIGNYVVETLLQRGCRVIASSLSAEKAAQFAWFSKVQYIQFDLAGFNEKRNYHQYFNNPDALIHLAWEGLPNYQATFHTGINLPRHFAFLKNMVAHGLRNLTVTGTCFEYGMQEGKLDEAMAAHPANPYAQAKDELRKALQALQPAIPFNFKWVRLFYMYGPGQHPKSLLSQLQKALGDGAPVFNMSGGEQVRDYLPVQQVAAVVVQAALQEKVTGIINCCSGVPITVKQLVENYLREQQGNIRLNLGYYPYTDYEPMAFWGDTKKLQSLFNQANEEIRL